MRSSRLFSIFIIEALLEACQEQSQPNQPVSGGLSGTTWQLTQVDTGNGSMAVGQADAIQLRFNDQRRISGTSAGLCRNTWFGVYTTSAPDSIRLDSLVSTEIACPHSQYWDCYNYLMRAETFQHPGAQLKVYCDGGARNLRFEAIQ